MMTSSRFALLSRRVRPVALLLGVVMVAAGGGGCNLGKDNVLFVTNTSIGIDLDTTPPTTGIGYNRYEGVIGPQFDGGRTLPVLSSINASQSLAPFGSGHSFATGPAAIVMAHGVGRPHDYFKDWEPLDGLNPKHVHNPLDSQGKLRPDEILYLRKPGNEDDGKEIRQRRRTLLATVTNLALAVEWDTTGIPQAVHLGYKRKELAYAPLVERRVPTTLPSHHHGGAYVLSMPSLLATANSSARVTSLKDATGTGVQVKQTFSTGHVATYLANNEQVRNVLAPALVEGGDEAVKERVTHTQLLDLTARRQPLVDAWRARRDRLRTADATLITNPTDTDAQAAKDDAENQLAEFDTAVRLAGAPDPGFRDWAARSSPAPSDAEMEAVSQYLKDKQLLP